MNRYFCGCECEFQSAIEIRTSAVSAFVCLPTVFHSTSRSPLLMGCFPPVVGALSVADVVGTCAQIDQRASDR